MELLSYFEAALVAPLSEFSSSIECTGTRSIHVFEEPGPNQLRLNGAIQSEKSADKFRMRVSYLVCYDICDEKRLRMVFKKMRAYGDHLQFSVFECQMTPIDLAKCRADLSEIINHKEDQVLFVNLGPAEGRGERVIAALGKPYTAIDSPCIVV
jgi:CRISPR-associated protein Cas2